MNVEKWMENMSKGCFERRETSVKWPQPRREDQDTEESAFEDTDGESFYVTHNRLASAMQIDILI